MNYKDVDISFFYHPTTVAVVDDNISYLENIRLQLSKDWPTLLFNDSKKALDLLKSTDISYDSYLHGIITIPCKDIEHDDGNAANSRTIKFNPSNIYKKIYDDFRFESISTTFVDFEMPSLDGIEFCDQLGTYNKQVRKIMLTGKADSSVAVKAFNNGTIDKFIVKGIDDSYDGLSRVLSSQTKKYFADLSRLLHDEVLVPSDSPIINDCYAAVFNKALMQSNFVEYYLLDLSGSFLFLDKYANPTILLVRRATDLDNYHKVATDSGATDSIIEKLQNKSHLLYLLSDEDYNQSPNEWDKFLYPALSSEDGTFFYTILNKEISGIELSKIKSFHDYLNKLPP